jgi:hypothetical protein
LDPAITNRSYPLLFQPVSRLCGGRWTQHPRDLLMAAGCMPARSTPRRAIHYAGGRPHAQDRSFRTARQHSRSASSLGLTGGSRITVCRDRSRATPVCCLEASSYTAPSRMRTAGISDRMNSYRPLLGAPNQNWLAQVSAGWRGRNV